jgi:hypothetical protein
MDMSMASGAYSAFSSVVSAYFANDVADAQAAGANQIRASNNRVTAAVNVRNSAITALQRWKQEVANSRVYEAVKSNQEALATNFNRARDQRTRQNFAVSIRNAEESGRQQASAAASGVTGSVVDVIDTTSRLKQGIEQQARHDAELQVDGDFKKKELATRLATMDSLDYSLVLDNVQQADYGVNTPKHINLLGAAISGKDTLKNVSQGLEFFFKDTEGGKYDINGSDSQSDNYRG